MRLRPHFCTVLICAALLAGVTQVLAPGAFTGGQWAPLHARCFGVTALAFAVTLALARRAQDPAALRVPLLAFAGWCLSTALALLLHDGALSWWPLAIAMPGAAALALARVDDDPPAPAQHLDPSWSAVAGVALLLAVTLLARPTGVALYWPWRLRAALVAQYAPMFLAWGVAAWQIARERRRYVRQPIVAGLLSWAVGVLAASLWHLGAFSTGSAGGVSAWVWFALFASLAALAAWQLRGRALRRRRRRLGPLSRDSGTRA